MNPSSIVSSTSAASHIDKLKSHSLSPFFGRILTFFKKAVRIHDETSGKTLYVRLDRIVQELLEGHSAVSGKTQNVIGKRILEIADPDTRNPLSMDKVRRMFEEFAADDSRHTLATDQEIIDELEIIKLRLTDIPTLPYDISLLEIAEKLKPGDILIRKYHENNDNLICTLQNLFHVDGYREAYKCSHLAVYLGVINGDHWVSEATMPHGEEPQVRRIRLDDPRFAPREKNQYLVIRNNSTPEAELLVKLARQYSLKTLPEEERPTTEGDRTGSYNYNYLEAARSLYHIPSLGPYGRHRILKYYADYENKLGYEYLGKPGTYFCSHFALAMESLAEMKSSDKFRAFIDEHPIPEGYDKTKTGIQLKISQLWYSFRKGLWARKLAFLYPNAIKESLHTHLDPLRSSPQDTVVYMMDDKANYKIVGQIYRKEDYPAPAGPGHLNGAGQ